jgi:hypothetical protein
MNHKEEKAIEAQKIIHDIRNIVTTDKKQL